MGPQSGRGHKYSRMCFACARIETLFENPGYAPEAPVPAEYVGY